MEDGVWVCDPAVTLRHGVGVSPLPPLPPVSSDCRARPGPASTLASPLVALLPEPCLPTLEAGSVPCLTALSLSFLRVAGHVEWMLQPPLYEVHRADLSSFAALTSFARPLLNYFFKCLK